MRLGQDNDAQSTLMGNAQGCGGVPGCLIINDCSATGIGQRVSQDSGFAIAQSERRHVGRNRPRIDGSQPRRLGQRLNGRVGRSSALDFQDGCLRDHHGGPQLLQQVKVSHATQQNHRRRVDDPECNHG